MKKNVVLCWAFMTFCLLNLYDSYGLSSLKGYDPPIFPQSISILRNDTVFCYNIFATNMAIDSIHLVYFSVKKKGTMYITTFEDGSYWVIRYKKTYKHASLERKMLNLPVGKVVKPKSIFRYDKDGKLTEYFVTFGVLLYSKQCRDTKTQ